MRSLARRARKRFFETPHANYHDLVLERAVVSFTFDDPARSAAEAGARLLEDRGCRATFYVASGLLSEPPIDPEHPLLPEQELRALADRGHDIQGHTYSHLNLRTASPRRIVRDCRRNREHLEQLLPGHEVEHFAYPYGYVSPWAKRALGSSYRTMRSTEAGVNRGPTDLRRLKAISLCSVDFDADAVRAAVDGLAEQPGWLVFFTHEISPSPSPWGTTPHDLEWVVDHCLDQGRRILTVSDAFRAVAAESEPRTT
jgi:peptidoglycan/xylan/chitin deacetylase (PgdA/CDA1 family)